METYPIIENSPSSLANQVLGILTFEDIFVKQPYLALIPAILFFLIYLKTRGKIIIFTAGVWALYAVFELLMKFRNCAPEPNCVSNVRVDLLPIYSVLVLLTVSALISIFSKLKQGIFSSVASK